MQYFYCIKAYTYIYKEHSKRVNTMKILLADKQDITRAGLSYVISKMEGYGNPDRRRQGRPDACLKGE